MILKMGQKSFKLFETLCFTTGNYLFHRLKPFVSHRETNSFKA